MSRKRYDTLWRSIYKTRDNQRFNRLVPYRFTEIGTYDGSNAEKAIGRLRKAGLINIEYTGFDLFEDLTPSILSEEFSKKNPPPPVAMVSARLAKTGAVINLHRGFTCVTLSQEVPRMAFQDLIFIDGGHSLGTIENDWKWCSKLMDSKTIVVMDDYYDVDGVGCQRLVRHLKETMSEYYTISVDGPEDIIIATGLRIRMATITRK